MANSRTDNSNRGDDRSSGAASTDQTSQGGRQERRSPALTPGVEQLGTGGLSASGGKAGGARGNSGTSDDGAGGPEGESRGGPGEYRSTSRGDLDRTTD